MASPKESAKEDDKRKKFLTLTDVVVNLIAFMAPLGLFYTTMPLMAAATSIDGGNAWEDMFTGTLCALVVAFITAANFAQLAKLYPRLDGVYGYAGAAFGESRVPGIPRAAGVLQALVGYSAVVEYWIYPAVCVPPLADVIQHLIGEGSPSGTSKTLGTPIGVAAIVLASLAGGYIALAGVRFSSDFNTGMVLIQTAIMIMISFVLAAYRIFNPRNIPPEEWTFNANLLIIPSTTGNVLTQTALAILILVGFEAAPNFSEEATRARTTVPTAMLVSLGHPLVMYLLAFGTATMFLSPEFTLEAPDGGEPLRAAAALAGSPHAISFMVIEAGDALLNGHGHFLMPFVGIGVMVSVFGSFVASLTTAVKITLHMSREGVLSPFFRKLHHTYGTPENSVWAVSAIAAALGILGYVQLDVRAAVLLASNLGTFLLFGTCSFANFCAHYGRPEFRVVTHGVLAFLGLACNALLLCVVVAGAFVAKGAALIQLFGAVAIVAAAFLLLALGGTKSRKGAKAAKRGAAEGAPEADAAGVDRPGAAPPEGGAPAPPPRGSSFVRLRTNAGVVPIAA